MIYLDVYKREYRVFFELTPLANIEFEYCNIWGIDVYSTSTNAKSYSLKKCILQPNNRNYYIINGEPDTYFNKYHDVPISSVESCLLYGTSWNYANEITNCCYAYSNTYFWVPKTLTNNLFLGSPTKIQMRLNYDYDYLISGNAFVNYSDMPKTLNECPMVLFQSDESTYTKGIRIENNSFFGYPDILPDRFVDSEKYKNEITSTSTIQNVWPFVSGYQFTNDKGEETTKFSKEDMNLKLYFNRAMDTTDPLSVRFGSVEPYADYIIDGTWVDEYTWQGKRDSYSH